MTTLEEEDGLLWEPLRETGAVLRPRDSYLNFELCAHGGQYVIVKNPNSKFPMETARGVHAHTLQVWRDLTSGRRRQRGY